MDNEQHSWLWKCLFDVTYKCMTDANCKIIKIPHTLHVVAPNATSALDLAHLPLSKQTYTAENKQLWKAQYVDLVSIARDVAVDLVMIKPGTPAGVNSPEEVAAALTQETEMHRQCDENLKKLTLDYNTTLKDLAESRALVAGIFERAIAFRLTLDVRGQCRILSLGDMCVCVLCRFARMLGEEK